VSARRAILVLALSAGALASEPVALSLPAGFDMPAVPAAKGRPLVVAIVDDGFRLDHVALRGLWLENPDEIGGNGVDDDRNGRIDDVFGWDVADGDGDVQPPADRLGDLGHGTHLASLVATVARAAWGEAAPDQIRLLPVKAVADRTDRPYVIPGYDGVAYALDRGADVVLCAWSVQELQAVQRAVLDRAAAQGVLVVGAAGNMGSDTPQYPAAHPGVLSVAAVGRDEARLPRSSWGGSVDLLAPGEEIEGADASGVDGVVARSGTSQAAALATGTAAVLWRLHPAWTASEVRAALRGSARRLDHADLRVRASMGAGLLDPTAAVRADPWAQRAIWASSVGDLPAVGGEQRTAAITAPGRVEAVRFELEVIRGGRKAVGEARVTIRAGRDQEAPLVYEGPLDGLPVPLLGPGHRHQVQLQGGGRGLRALLHYRAEPIDVSAQWCRGTVELGAPGVLGDGSGAEAYAPGTDCRWLITAPEGQVVRFVFEELDTEPLVDQVLFFVGPTTAGPMFAGVSGTEAPPTLVSWGPQVLVWFVTDVHNEGQGWRARYEFIPAP
jgi:hypothetical protein